MQPDFSNIVFNPNHKLESRGIQALSGLRLLLQAFVLYAITIVIVVALELAGPDAIAGATSSLLWAAFWICSLAGFATGAYGTYLVIDALDWAKFIGYAIIASFLVPYFRMVAIVVLCVLAIDLVSKSGHRLSLFGKARKRRSFDTP